MTDNKKYIGYGDNSKTTASDNDNLNTVAYEAKQDTALNPLLHLQKDGPDDSSKYFSDFNLSEKENLILDAAVKIFSEKGFSAATTNEIAKTAGVAEGTIFRYYKTKKEILRTLHVLFINLLGGKLVLDGVEKILDDCDDKELKDVFKSLIMDRIKLIDSIFPIARIVLTEALYHKDIREAIYQTIISRAISAFEIFRIRASERQLLRDNIPSEIMLRNFIGNVFMLVAQRKLFGDKFDLPSLEEDIEMSIDIFLYGVARK
jgi:AcrR family transcriptional regulator